MTDQDTSKELHDFLTNDPDEAIGLATGMNADGTVNVQGENGSVNAIAATPCTTQPTLLQRANGTWYAFQSPNQTISDNTLISRRSRPNIQSDTNPIKVLFYIRTAQGYDWYVGGDRKNPIKIYSTTTLPEVQFSNTGRRRNEWVAGFKFSNSDIYSYRVVNVYADKIYTCIQPWTYLLQWIGFGTWTGIFAGNVTATRVVNTVNVIIDNLYSTSPLVSGSGSSNYISTDTGEGGMPPPPISSKTDIVYSVGNLGFAFNKKIDITQENKSENTQYTSKTTWVMVSSTNAKFTSNDTSSINRNSIIPTYVFYKNNSLKNIINSENNYNSNSSDTYGTNVLNPTYLNSGIELVLTITPQISGTNSYIYRRQKNTNTTSNSDTTTIKEDTLLFVKNKSSNDNKKEETDINYDTTKFQALSPKLGANLISNNYYLVLPSIQAKYFQKDLWQDKTLASYQNSPNIYDKPEDKLTNIPVWKATINTKNKTIEVKDDVIVKKFYPLLKGAVVVAASYYA